VIKAEFSGSLLQSRQCHMIIQKSFEYADYYHCWKQLCFCFIFIWKL